jgi:hypothetical protein
MLFVRSISGVMWDVPTMYTSDRSSVGVFLESLKGVAAEELPGTDCDDSPRDNICLKLCTLESPSGLLSGLGPMVSCECGPPLIN